MSSTDRCNTLSKLLRWGLEEQGHSGTFVGLPRDGAELDLAVQGQVGASTRSAGDGCRIRGSQTTLRQRRSHVYGRCRDPRVATYARAHRLDLLPEDLRSEVADELEYAALKNFDASFFGEHEKLALIPPLRLVGLGVGLPTSVLPSLEERIDEITADADLNEEPYSHFEKLLGVLDRVETIGVDGDAISLIDDALEQVKRSIRSIEERKQERDEEADTTDWTHIVTQKNGESPTAAPLPPPTATKRSVFDDVDK